MTPQITCLDRRQPVSVVVRIDPHGVAASGGDDFTAEQLEAMNTNRLRGAEGVTFWPLVGAREPAWVVEHTDGVLALYSESELARRPPTEFEAREEIDRLRALLRSYAEPRAMLTLDSSVPSRLRFVVTLSHDDDEETQTMNLAMAVAELTREFGFQTRR